MDRALEKATVLIELRRFAEAADMVARVIAGDPENGHAWCVLAQAYLGLDKPAEALKAAVTALSLDPEQEWAHRLASAAFGRLARHEEALRAAREAVRCDPHEPQTFVRLAVAGSYLQWALGEAAAAAHQAVLLAPHAAATHGAVGIVACAAGRRRTAESAFRRALAIDPQNLTALNGLAALHLQRSNLGRAGELADAAGGFAMALRTDPRSTESRRNLDYVIRVFLARVAYYVFVDAYLMGFAFRASHAVAARLAPVVLLSLPLGYSYFFLRRLSPQLRAHVRDVVRRRSTALPLSLEVIAGVLLVVAAVTPQGVRTSLATVAGVSAVAGRLMMRTQAGGRPTAVRSARSRYALGPAALLIIGTACILFGLMLVAGLPSPTDRKVPLAITAVVFLSAGVASIALSIRRRRTLTPRRGRVRRS